MKSLKISVYCKESMVSQKRCNNLKTTNNLQESIVQNIVLQQYSFHLIIQLMDHYDFVFDYC